MAPICAHKVHTWLRLTRSKADLDRTQPTHARPPVARNPRYTSLLLKKCRGSCARNEKRQERCPLLFRCPDRVPTAQRPVLSFDLPDTACCSIQKQPGLLLTRSRLLSCTSGGARNSCPLRSSRSRQEAGELTAHLMPARCLPQETRHRAGRIPRVITRGSWLDAIAICSAMFVARCRRSDARGSSLELYD